MHSSSYDFQMEFTGIASHTQLPPSPELRSGSSDGYLGSDSFSLDPDPSTGTERNPRSRLVSIARYSSFQPQALACSPPLPVMYSESQSSSGKRGVSSASATLLRRTPTELTGTTSLGALAGLHGVAVFRVSKPHEPLLVLKHATGFNSTNRTLGNGVRSLSFQPDSSQSFYLAAARGSGVLVWDVSGHSLSPLWGRLEIDNGTTGAARPPITSICWQPVTNNAPYLAASTAKSACIWDLRESAVASTHFKPSLRFGISRKNLVTAAPYVQLACSGQNECAILDAAGMLRIFDMRLTDRSRLSMGDLSSFAAFSHAGVGVAHMGKSLSSENARWVAWGLDAPSGRDATVKVWSETTGNSQDVSEVEGNASENLWLTDTPSGQDTPMELGKISDYHLSAQCTLPNLACARVCPIPTEDSILTVSLTNNEGLPSWKADLWKLTNDTGTQSMKRIVSFTAGEGSDYGIMSTVENADTLGNVCASELAIVNPLSSIGGTAASLPAHSTLILCSLTENGYVTTHVSCCSRKPILYDKKGISSPCAFGM